MKLRLVAHWRLWWRRWSTWLAVIYAAVTALNPGLIVGLLGMFPGDYRGFASGGLFVLLVAVPVVTTQLSQAKLKEQRDGQ